jgi:hypothetical protein
MHPVLTSPIPLCNMFRSGVYQDRETEFPPLRNPPMYMREVYILVFKGNDILYYVLNTNSIKPACLAA